MDDELTRTLGELERKILELERTLSAMTHAEQGMADKGLIARSFPPAPLGPPAPGPPSPSAAAAPLPSAAAPPLPSAAAAAAAQPSPAAAPSQSAGPSISRIVDESIERPPEPVAEPATPRWPEHPPAHAPAPAPAAEPYSSLGSPPPQAPPVSQSPSAADLLRFRERLERSTRDLADDYDALLGRLSYAAVPTATGPTPNATGPTISFARGAPSLDIVDVAGLRDAAVRAFDSDPAGATAYGTSVGYPRLRSWIADHHGVEPERVLVTNGSMQADAFLFEHLVHQGDEVIVERPSYDRTLLSLRQRGAQLHAVELEPDGIDTDALARLLAGGTVAPKLAHIIPNFQNPAGYTLSMEKRRWLLALAAEHGFAVFEDDPYVALRFSGETLPTMLSMDPDRVVYASSFSKTVCPGIRVGYLVGPRDLIASVAQLATNTYISPNMVAQAIVYEFCASGAIDRSIETVKAALAERAQALGSALNSQLPDAQFVLPQGGYFMWVTLPEGTDVERLFRAAGDRGVSFVKGTDFLLEGGENTLRLAYSGVTPEQIDTGVARLAEAYRSL